MGIVLGAFFLYFKIFSVSILNIFLTFPMARNSNLTSYLLKHTLCRMPFPQISLYQKNIMISAEGKMWLISVFYSLCFISHKQPTGANWFKSKVDYKLMRRKERLLGTPLAVVQRASSSHAQEPLLQACCLRW